VREKRNTLILSASRLENRLDALDRHVIRLCGRELDRPGHICAFFTSPDQEYETIIPYLRDGLAEGERVLNIVDDDTITAHRGRLNAAGISTAGEGVRVQGAAETYLETGRFEMDRMVSFVETALAGAKAEGKLVRTCGHMSWLRKNAPGSERAIEYEARMNYLFPKYDCTFMCAYYLPNLGGDTIADLFATHPYVIVNGEIRENSHYIPPDVYLGELFGQRKARLS
jgi:hypothetical protein